MTAKFDALPRRGFLVALAGLGLSRHVLAAPLFEEILSALEGWQPERRSDELAYESDVADCLKTLGFDVRRGVKLAHHHEAGVIVHDDVLVEVRAHLTTITEQDRAIQQLDAYAATWPGSIIFMICGDHRPALRAPLAAKVSSLRARGRAVAMIVAR